MPHFSVFSIATHQIVEIVDVIGRLTGSLFSYTLPLCPVFIIPYATIRHIYSYFCRFPSNDWYVLGAGRRPSIRLDLHQSHHRGCERADMNYSDRTVHEGREEIEEGGEVLRLSEPLGMSLQRVPLD